MKLFADILGSIAETFILFYFYTTFLKNTKLEQKYLMLLYILDGLFCLTYSTIAQTPVQRSFCFFIFVLVPLFFYRKNLGAKIASLVIYYATIGLTELLVKTILIGYHGDFAIFYQSYEYNYFLGVLFSKTIAFILVYCYTFIIKIRKGKIPIYLYCFLLFVPALSIIVFYFLQTIVYTINEKSVYTAHCYITFILLLFNLIIFFLFSQAAEASWLRAKLTYEKQIISEQQLYHKSLVSYQERLRQINHDMKKHFLILYQSLSENNTAAAMKYLSEQLEFLSNHKMTYSGYLMLDTIFDYKNQLAMQQETKYTIYSELESDLVMSEKFLEDLSIIIASCIDNALEATAKIPEPQKRWIKIKIYNDTTYIYLQFENSVQKTVPVEKSQIPATTKADQLLHGLGLRNVKRLTEEIYGGKLILDCHNLKFTVGIMLKY